MIDQNNNGIEDSVETEIAKDEHKDRRTHDRRERKEESTRYLMDWLVVGFALLFAVVFFSGGLYYLFVVKAEWLLVIIQTQFAAIVMPPLTVGTSIVIVSVLKMSSGDVKFKVFGMSFEGSSAPIVMFLAVYGLIISSVQMLWVTS